jgi:ribonucleoside-diphosphate reductase alpha chain
MAFVGSNGDGRIQELTARLGKGGGCASSQAEAIARLASIAMQNGVDPEAIIKQLSGIRCHTIAMHRSEHTDGRSRQITSCSDAISVALSEHLAEMTGTKVESSDASEHVGACPECGSSLSHTGGCRGGTCTNCGFSSCG